MVTSVLFNLINFASTSITVLILDAKVILIFTMFVLDTAILFTIELFFNSLINLIFSNRKW